jgi:mRNA interferase RelE/StbE
VNPSVPRPVVGSGASGRSRRGRHPSAVAVEVRVTTPAFEDLKTLSRANPQATRWALKKLLHIGRDPEAGEPLHGDLIGWRKPSVGNRDWRVIWRVTYDESGTPIVDVAEVLAVGARSDSAVYAEMLERVISLPNTPSTMALADVVSRIGKVAADLGTAEDKPPVDPLPDWLSQRLSTQMGFSSDRLKQMAFDEALAAWEAFLSRPR